jgi:negative regulator of flagellin synthesis FlgM
MKINGITTGKIDQYYKKMQQHQAAQQSESKDDSTKISARAKIIMTARAELKNIAEPGSEKIANLKAELKNGSYQVDSQQISAKILKKFK